LEDTRDPVKANDPTRVGVTQANSKLSAVATSQVAQRHELNHDRNLP